MTACYDLVTKELFSPKYGKVTVLEQQDFRKIRVVKIPDSVTVLGYGTFFQCAALERVEMGKNLKYINPWAFGECINLKTIVWSTSLEYIEPEAFRLTGIETLKIPEGVKKISRGAFEACTELRSAYIPDTVEDMGDNLFADCSKLLSVRLPRNEKCTTLNPGFCDGCDSLITLDIPENIHQIESFSLPNKSFLAIAFHAPNLTLRGNFNSIKMIVYPDTEHNNRVIESKTQDMPNLQLFGLIQSTGKVKWHNRTGPLVAGLTDSDIVSAGLTRSDIASLFPEKKALLMETMINMKLSGQWIDGPPMVEIQRNIFPEVFAVEDFLRRYGGYRRVVNALNPGTWLEF